MNPFSWLNDQLLKMQWLSDLVRAGLEGLGVDVSSRVGGSVHFFIYDTIKIFILLATLIFVVSWIQSHFPPERTRRILGGMRGIRANTVGALLGTLTPFCSCSSIPLFIGFTSAGLPLGVTFAFLISSPLVDLASMVLLASVFNWTVALAYVVVGIVLAVIGGTLIGALRMEDQVEAFVTRTPATDIELPRMQARERATFALEQVRDIIRRVWVYVLIGVGIGAAIHNWIPQETVAAVLGADKWWAVPVAVLVGIPIYADIFGTLPIAEALVAKEVGLGTILAFMMSVTALSLPSLVMLKRVVKPRLLATFFAIVVFGIVLVGLLFNAIAPLLPSF